MECVGVSKRFGRFVAVDNVSFRIAPGSFFSILGPSGCGKTTLLRMIAGFEKPDGGDILINSKSVLSTPPNSRDAKMVFQHLALFPMMNVADNIAYGLRCKGEPTTQINKAVEEVLERVGLPGSGKKEIHQLSGGQKQRVAIARCMVLRPEALLLDEPLGALDLKLREHMKVELKMLQRKLETTFVYITHDQSEALVMSDLVAVMNRGRFEQVAPPQELYHSPKTAFVAGFVGDSNRWRGKVTVQTADGVRVETESGLSFVGAGDGLSVGDLADVFVRPEVISIASADAPPLADANEQDGVVNSVLFNGANSKALVSIAGGMIEVALPQTAGFSPPRQGERARLSWSDCKCFAADSAPTEAANV